MDQLHLRFIQAAKKHSGKLAVADKGTNQDYGYGRMLIASFILKEELGKIPGKYIGMLLPTSMGAMLGVISTLFAGKIPVMINYATGAIDNCLYARQKCNFKTVVTSKKLLDKLGLKPIDHMIFVEDILQRVSTLAKLKAAMLSKLPYAVLKNLVHNGSSDEVSVILFTSGSEKEPKAVQLSHRNILHNIDGIHQLVHLDHNDVFLSILPVFHVFGLVTQFWLPVLMGATLVTYPNPLEYRTVSDLVKQYRATFMAATPSFFHGYLAKSDPGDYSSMKLAIAGADKLPDKIFEGFLTKHNISIFEGYGTTETSPVISVN
ncbi:MAG TPA: AMP-binding protein, partial [Candidatus Cloacimonadota bacterium]|nr:AMP-binding protein [Candidatus Cloacimonadota bacterium]